MKLGRRSDEEDAGGEDDPGDTHGEHGQRVDGHAPEPWNDRPKGEGGLDVIEEARACHQLPVVRSKAFVTARTAS